MIDPIVAQIIAASLVYASEEMGIAVRNAAYSPNIKERLDHSCALFDARGRLIAQAEHIPVHLGSLPWGLRRTLAEISTVYGRLRAGDMWVVNDPYLSGTHLNDVTVIRPIFFKGTLVGYAANKAHHADIGGSVPGSISVDAADLFGEGLIVPPLPLVRDNQIETQTVELFAANSRTPAARGGDLRAQVAGNIVGERRVIELYERYGVSALESAIERSLDASERRTRAGLANLGNGTFVAHDALEDRDGKPTIDIHLRLTLRDGEARFDYAGTHAEVNYPLNAVYGVTLSGVYYALRAVTDPTIPMNDGCFRPIFVDVPPGTLLHPNRPAPVGGGNVETSTRNADVVLQALAQAAPQRVPAASGGTMSNVMLGGVRADGTSWTFYETNGCGMGARPNADGIDGIQCHMTNTLNTPIEAIERDFPLLVTRYEFAARTGGAGRFRGGDGLIRGLALTEGTAHATLLADRHTVAPSGAAGGGAGACGAHRLIHANGKVQTIPAKTSFAWHVGETIEVQTPGGGGYGEAGGLDEGDGEAE